MRGPWERARSVAWYFGIGSSAEAERRRLERDEEDEARPWWREALVIVSGAVVVEVFRATVGLDRPLHEYLVPAVIFVAVSLVVAVWIRSRRAERPPAD